MYVAAALRKAGHLVELCNLSATPTKKAAKKIPLDADFYGMTSTCIDYHECYELAQILRKLNCVAPIALGGPFCTVAPELVDNRVFNTFCIGEGEQVALEMINDTKRRALKPQYIGKRIRDLDTISWPARDLMDNLGEDVFAGGSHYFEGGSTVIISSRGCPFRCAFCASRPVWGGKVFFRKAKSVVQEVAYVKNRYGIRQFRFSDDALNLNRRRLRILCEGLAKLDIVWRCSIRAGISTPEDLKLMYDAGCREISPGIESGDQRVLDFLCKQTTTRHNRDLINWASAAGINVRILLMSGTPGEHPNTPELTKRFLSSADYRLVSLTQFRPIPGSAIWCKPQDFNCRIVNRDLKNYNFYFWHCGVDGLPQESKIESVIETDSMPKEALEDNMLRMRQYVLETGRCNRG